MDQGLYCWSSWQSCCSVLHSDGGPGSRWQLASYINCNNEAWTTDMSSSYTRQQMQRLQGLLGQVNSKYLLWWTLKNSRVEYRTRLLALRARTALPSAYVLVRASSLKLQAPSSKHQAPSFDNIKRQASSPKQQASSAKPEASSSMMREPRNIWKRLTALGPRASAMINVLSGCL